MIHIFKDKFEVFFTELKKLFVFFLFLFFFLHKMSNSVNKHSLNVVYVKEYIVQSSGIS